VAAESYRSALRYDPRYASGVHNLVRGAVRPRRQVAAREALIRAVSWIHVHSCALNLAHRCSMPARRARRSRSMRELVEFHPHERRRVARTGTTCVKLEWLDAARSAFIARPSRNDRGTQTRATVSLACWARVGDAEGCAARTEAALAAGRPLTRSRAMSGRHRPAAANDRSVRCAGSLLSRSGAASRSTASRSQSPTIAFVACRSLSRCSSDPRSGEYASPLRMRVVPVTKPRGMRCVAWWVKRSTAMRRRAPLLEPKHATPKPRSTCCGDARR
jgi:hypothetical protein